jgi:hypothetical protein
VDNFHVPTQKSIFNHFANFSLIVCTRKQTGNEAQNLELFDSKNIKKLLQDYLFLNSNLKNEYLVFCEVNCGGCVFGLISASDERCLG